MASADFQFSAELIPLICLSYWFFSAASFFNLPMLLEKQTTALLPASAFAVLVNLGANWTLVPRLGATGAGIATLITFMTLSTIAYFVGRRVRPINFPIQTMALALAFVLTVWGLWRFFITPGSSQIMVYSSAAVLWSVTALVFVVTTVPWGEARHVLRSVNWKGTLS
jgi:O-antigen/teichoic acid export membrane protein